MPTFAITGVSGSWGRRVAERLLATPDARVLGIDRRPPDPPLAGLDFVKADIRNPLLAELLRVEQVQTLVHLAWRERQWRREEDFESNVLGSMQLLGACAEAGVRQVVWRSTTAVYGAQAENPFYLPEEAPLAARSSYAWVQDALEVERFIVEFSADYPALRIAVLRLANVVGLDFDTPFTRLLSLPVWPELLGFDPVLQVIDGDDAVDALVQAAQREWRGPLNVAASGAVSLMQLAGMVGRPLAPLSHLLLAWGWPLLQSTPTGRGWLRWLPLEPAYLRYPWLASINRLHQDFDWQARLSAREAVRRYIEARRMARYRPAPEADRYAGDDVARVLQGRSQSSAAPAAPLVTRGGIDIA